MGKKIEKLLRLVIILLGLYLLFESFLYFFDIRLMDVKAVWSSQAIVYAKLIEEVLGSTFLFIAVIILFEVQKNMLKYKNFIKISALWALLHGILLIYLSFSQNYIEVFKSFPSLMVWFPLYDKYVAFEGIVIICFSMLVYLWIKTNEQKQY